MSGGAYQDWSLDELCRRHGISYQAGLRWISKGYLKARKNDYGIWRMSLIEGIAFSALAAGKSPEDARKEADEIYRTAGSR